MPQPELLPSAADLVNLVYILLVAALTVGLGWLAGARRLETAFFSGWGAACLIFIVAGTWLSVDLALAADLAGLLGVLGWLRRFAWPAEGQTGSTRLALCVLLLGAPFVFLVLGMTDIAWDDFAFWLPNLLHLCATHHFPTLADPAAASAMAAYPYGLALPGFAVHLLGGPNVETVALVWNLLAMLAAAAAFAAVLARRMRTAGAPDEPLATRTLWALAALGVLLEGMASPTFVAKIILTNMGDSASGAGLALLCALLFEWTSAAPKSPERASILTEIALAASAIAFVRQENPALLGMLFLSAAAALLWFDARTRWPALAGLFASLIPAVFVWFSWTRYADAEIPHGRHYLLPPSQWHWSIYGDTLAAAVHVLLAKSGYTLMTIAMGVIVVRAVVRQRRAGSRALLAPEAAAATVTATATAGLAYGNIVFLLFCYLGTSFYPGEAKQAIAFWRFISQTGQSLMIGFACVVPTAWLTTAFRRTWLNRALPVVAFLVPIAAIPTYRDDFDSPVPRLRTIAEAVQHAVPPGKPVELLDISGDGFATLVVKYQMMAIAHDRQPISVIAAPHGLSLAQARSESLAAESYVWLAEGSPTFGQMFGQPTNTGCSYLFDKGPQGFHLLQDWNIGPHAWSTEAIDRRARTPPGCAG